MLIDSTALLKIGHFRRDVFWFWYFGIQLKSLAKKFNIFAIESVMVELFAIL